MPTYVDLELASIFINLLGELLLPRNNISLQMILENPNMQSVLVFINNSLMNDEQASLFKHYMDKANPNHFVFLLGFVLRREE